MAIWCWAKRAALLLGFVFIAKVAVRAIVSSYDNAGFPELLAVKLETLPVIFPLHMITGGAALLLVPLAIGLKGTRWHRWAGRVAAVDVSIAAITAIPVALAYPISSLAAAGFATQGLVWLGLLLTGLWQIRNKRFQQHQRAMLLMAAVTFGAVVFRINLASFAAFGPHKYFALFYGLNAWIAWLVPLCIMAFATARTIRIAKTVQA